MGGNLAPRAPPVGMGRGEGIGGYLDCLTVEERERAAGSR